MIEAMPDYEDRRRIKSIMLVITRLGIGGAESQVRDLALAFHRLGLIVSIVSLRKPQAHVDVLRGEGIEVHSLDMDAAWAFAPAVLKLAALVRHMSPDVVHSHCYHANILCRCTRLVAPSMRLVCTAHSTFEISRKRGQSTRNVRDRVYRYTDFLSHYNTHVTLAGLERYIGSGLFQKSNASWMPNGIDFPMEVGARRSNKYLKGLGWEDGIFVWFHAGRLTRAKNQEMLLKSYAEVARFRPDSVLAIAGEGELEGELKSLANSLGLAPKVQFLGLRDDIPELMSCADGFVLSSDWEGLPIVLLEAAVAGLPCVATKVGDVPKVIETPDLLVPPGDAGLLAQAMLRLMEMTPERRQELGNAFRESIKTRFSLDRIVDQWLQIYEKVATNRPH